MYVRDFDWRVNSSGDDRRLYGGSTQARRSYRPFQPVSPPRLAPRVRRPSCAARRLFRSRTSLWSWIFTRLSTWWRRVSSMVTFTCTPSPRPATPRLAPLRQAQLPSEPLLQSHCRASYRTGTSSLTRPTLNSSRYEPTRSLAVPSIFTLLAAISSRVRSTRASRFACTFSLQPAHASC